MDIVPICVYPLFTAVFMALKLSQQLWLSLMLPIIKRLLRHVIWLVMRDNLDLVGPTTCSVGHLYHVLFTAMCLQNAKSLETLAAIVLVNVLHMLLNCQDIMKDAANIERLKDQLRGDSSISVTGDVISETLQLAEREQVFKSLHLKSPSRMFSKYPGYQRIELVARHQNVLQKIKPAVARNVSSSRSDLFGQNPRRDGRHWSLQSAKSLSMQQTALIEQNITRILPLANESATVTRSTLRESGHNVTVSEKSLSTTPSMQQREDRARQSEIYVRSVTSALHQTEIILLRSYITIFVLSFYGIYLVLVFWLPNRRYFATMATMTTFAAVDSMIFRLFLLGSIEVIFLAMYLVLISHQLGVSGLHQLAFVLWSQRVLLQAKFTALSLMILGFPLEHYGNSVIYKLRPE